MRRPTPTAPGGLRQLTGIARTARRMPCTDSLTSRRKAAVHASCAVAKQRAAYAAAAAGGFGRSKGVLWCAHAFALVCVRGEGVSLGGSLGLLRIDAGETRLAAATSTATGSALLKRSKCVPAPVPVCRARCVRIAPERVDVVGDVVAEWWR